ncbi:MAG: AAA family ATPase [Candidatus Woesearchaeota archaeon]
MGKVIVITGTPAVGKSTLAVKLAKKIKFTRLDLHKYYKEISTGYDKSGKCYIIDIKKLEKLVAEKKKTKNLIVDSHIAHLLPKKLVDLCIVLVCSNLKKLEKRLQERKYNKQKIRENLDAEIFQVCYMEAKEKKHKVIVVDVNKRIDIDEIVKKIKKKDDLQLHVI